MGTKCLWGDLIKWVLLREYDVLRNVHDLIYPIRIGISRAFGGLVGIYSTYFGIFLPWCLFCVTFAHNKVTASGGGSQQNLVLKWTFRKKLPVLDSIFVFDFGFVYWMAVV